VCVMFSSSFLSLFSKCLVAVLIIIISTCPTYHKVKSKIGVYHWSELNTLASKVSMAELDKVTGRIKANECCAYIYTSGTTGAPKAVMCTHDNIVYETRAALTCMEEIGSSESEERVIRYIPHPSLCLHYYLSSISLSTCCDPLCEQYDPL
jgi:long-subunit acyl-CoA synthetase (AMP-forming)